MGEIVTKIFTGFTETIRNFGGGIKDAFLQIIYEDPTASERTLSALAEFGFVMLGISLALGLVHMAVRLIRR